MGMGCSSSATVTAHGALVSARWSTLRLCLSRVGYSVVLSLTPRDFGMIATVAHLPPPFVGHLPRIRIHSAAVSCCVSLSLAACCFCLVRFASQRKTDGNIGSLILRSDSCPTVTHLLSRDVLLGFFAFSIALFLPPLRPVSLRRSLLPHSPVFLFSSRKLTRPVPLFCASLCFCDRFVTGLMPAAARSSLARPGSAHSVLPTPFCPAPAMLKDGTQRENPAVVHVGGLE